MLLRSSVLAVSFSISARMFVLAYAAIVLCTNIIVLFILWEFQTCSQYISIILTLWSSLWLLLHLSLHNSLPTSCPLLFYVFKYFKFYSFEILFLLYSFTYVCFAYWPLSPPISQSLLPVLSSTQITLTFISIHFVLCSVGLVANTQLKTVIASPRI